MLNGKLCPECNNEMDFESFHEDKEGRRTAMFSCSHCTKELEVSNKEYLELLKKQQ